VRMRSFVRHRVLVVDMGGRGAELVRDEVGTVALGPIEEERVRERVAIDVRTGVDLEARGGGAERPGDFDLVRAGSNQVVEVERVDERVDPAPGAEAGADR